MEHKYKPLKTLKEIREMAGFTQQELAKKSKVNVATIRALETGINDPLHAKLSTLVALCKALGTRVKYLYPFIREIG